jgi:hypothetical protein
MGNTYASAKSQLKEETIMSNGPTVIFQDEDVRVSLGLDCVIVQQRQYADYSIFTDGIVLRLDQVPLIIEQLREAASTLFIDKVHAILQRLPPLTAADYKANGNPTKEALKRVRAAVASQFTPQEIEEYEATSARVCAFDNLIARHLYPSHGAYLEARLRQEAADELQAES